ncbi:diadenosine tetraphosphatase [Pseudoruegeria aquimaris]|uniref:Diadenosine tetraphosphatase n=1 Tax=Pseudoruegeria aquimaris TaxID=393663 RepID=A0A1Y5RZJ7_9RHOB|nr:metallophosphoesterase [Pseudoruegeria aquimaris]SLN28927.1 diadenosine tetraphosphatase [Pseudoruegeria aquimaris]
MRYYAIGDVHGHLEQLKRAHELIRADIARCGQPAPVVHLGDLIDRGPESRGVIDYLMKGIAAGEPWHVLKGNHDRYLERFYRERITFDPNTRTGLVWFDHRLGGAQTLASYGVEASENRDPAQIQRDAHAAVPEAHIRFIEGLPLCLETEDLIFVHAGIRPGVPMAQQAEDDLLWIRDGFLDDDTDHGRLVVHGHTALEAPEHFGNRVDLDGGTGYGRPLIPALFEGRDAWLLGEGGRSPLLPPEHRLQRGA